MKSLEKEIQLLQNQIDIQTKYLMEQEEKLRIVREELNTAIKKWRLLNLKK